MAKSKSKHPIETKGGYEIEKFKKLKKPLERGILKPMIYSGIIYDPRQKKHETIYWNEDGKCSNSLRNDCYITINKTK